jgi:hypothetical protein
MKITRTLLQNLRVAFDNAAARILDLGSTAPTPVLVPVRETRKIGLVRRFAPVLAIAALASPAHATWFDADLGTWADGRIVDAQIRVDGEPSPLYWSPNGDQRRYVQAFAGRNYSIVLRNNTSRRVAVLLAVDGLNAVNGERTSLNSREPMYVLSPYESATISGWRTSLEEVRRFVFVDEHRSYAERTGQANSDMGWIRVLSFREQETLGWFNRREDDRRWREPASGRDDRKDDLRAARPSGDKEQAQDAPAPTASRQEAPPPSANEGRREVAKSLDGMASPEQGGSFPGTGWGERRSDPIRQVEFRPERNATDQLVFRYEYASGLRALGIFPNGRDRLRERDGGQVGFAKPPRW